MGSIFQKYSDLLKRCGQYGPPLYLLEYNKLLPLTLVTLVSSSGIKTGHSGQQSHHLANLSCYIPTPGESFCCWQYNVAGGGGSVWDLGGVSGIQESANQEFEMINSRKACHVGSWESKTPISGRRDIN